MRLDGLEDLMKTINTLADDTAKKLAKATVNGCVSQMAATIRRGVDGSGASIAVKAEARKLVAKRLMRKEGQDTVGKVGFGVGKQNDRRKGAHGVTAHERSQAGQGNHGYLSGVGMSASNVHWFVLGTVERKTASGHETGRMRSLLAGIIQAAISGGNLPRLTKEQNKLARILAAEARKAAKARAKAMKGT